MTPPPDLAAIRAYWGERFCEHEGGVDLPLICSECTIRALLAALDRLDALTQERDLLRRGYESAIDNAIGLQAALDRLAPATADSPPLPGHVERHEVQPVQVGPGDSLYRLDAALHASAPPEHKCADCTIDREPCPDCYEVAWKKRHPNTLRIRPDRLDAVTVEEVADVIRAHATPQRWQLWSPDRAAAAVLALLRERREGR